MIAAFLLLVSLGSAETMTMRGALLRYKGGWNPESAPMFTQTFLTTGTAWLTAVRAHVVGEDGRPGDPRLLGALVIGYGRIGFTYKHPWILLPSNGALSFPQGFGYPMRPREIYLLRGRLKLVDPSSSGRAAVEVVLTLRRPEDGPPPKDLFHSSHWLWSDKSDTRTLPIFHAPAGRSNHRERIVAPVSGRLYAANAFMTHRAAAVSLRLERGGPQLLTGPTASYSSANGVAVRRGDILVYEVKFELPKAARLLSGVNLFIHRDRPSEAPLIDLRTASAYNPERDDPAGKPGGSLHSHH